MKEESLTDQFFQMAIPENELFFLDVEVNFLLINF